MSKSKPSDPTISTLKTVAVGYGGVGKTSMYVTYATENFPDVYCPTVFENYTQEDLKSSQGDNVNLQLWDTGGACDYDRLRPLSYPDTDVFILCFTVEARSRLEETETYWHAELYHHCPHIPIILVATKIDLRDDDKNSITTEEGREMARKIGATGYMEISSLRKEGLDELFQNVVDIGFEYFCKVKKMGKRKCKMYSSKPSIPTVTRLKTVAVGYVGVGITSMYITYTSGSFPDESLPTGFESHIQEDLKTSKGDNIILHLWDVGDYGDDYDSLRLMSYPDTHVLILCFSIESVSRSCFEKTQSFWHAELHHHCPDVPIILVATKIDVRDDDRNAITTEEGREMADKIGAEEYMEISSLRKEGLDELFQKVVDIGFKHYRRKMKVGKRKCNLI